MVLLVPPALPSSQGTAITIVSVTVVATPTRKILQQSPQARQQLRQQRSHGEGRMLLSSGGVEVVYLVASPKVTSSSLSQVCPSHDSNALSLARLLVH